MTCDRCGKTIEGDALVSLGAKRADGRICRGCWTQETRSSNNRLISALNAITRDGSERVSPPAPRAGVERREEPGRREERRQPGWHL